MQNFAEFLPLLLFFAAYFVFDIWVATGVLMASTLIFVPILWVKNKKMPLRLLITAGLVVLFGGLTFLFQDERFVKMKPTIVQLCLAGALMASLTTNKAWGRYLLGSPLRLTEKGRRQLTKRFALFFVGMAGLNEIVWRTQTTDFWVSFKLFGAIGLTLLFAFSQLGFIRRHLREEDPAQDDPQQTP